MGRRLAWRSPRFCRNSCGCTCVPATGGDGVKPLAIFGGIVAVGLAVIFVGLRLTDHPTSANPPPTPLTHAQFVRAGNAICDRYYRDDPTIFSNPKTVKALTKDMRIAVPYVDREAAGLRALLPPPSDAATYRRLLGGLGQVGHAAHAMLHDFETGQIRQGVLIARSTARMDSHLNSLANKVGLNICGLTGRQVRARYGKARGAAVPAVHKTRRAARHSVSKTAGATAPRLEGRYATVTEVVSVYHNGTAYPGETAHRTWTFTPHCSTGSCVITLLRPADTPGIQRIYSYTLRPIGGNRYRGERADPDSCQVMNPNTGQVSTLPNSFINYGTITVHATQASQSRVTAYDGTFLWRAVPQAVARAHGCTVTGRILTVFHGVR
jgi:hypothetical protein